VRRERRCEVVIDYSPLHRGKTLSGRRLPVKRRLVTWRQSDDR
jgi:hypothetical protein